MQNNTPGYINLNLAITEALSCALSTLTLKNCSDLFKCLYNAGTGIIFSNGTSIGYAGTTTTGTYQIQFNSITNTYTLVSGGSGVTSVNGLTGAVSLSGSSSIAISAGNVFTINPAWTGQPTISTVGTITTGVWNGSIIPVPNGGTGVGTFTPHALLVGNVTSPINSLTTGGLGSILLSQGSLADPTWLSPGSTGQVLTAVGGATNPIWVTPIWGSGTVSNVSGLNPLFTSIGSGTGSIIFSLINPSANTIFGNPTATTTTPPVYFTPHLASLPFGNEGTVNMVLHGNPSGVFSWGLVNLSSGVTGNLAFSSLPTTGLTDKSVVFWKSSVGFYESNPNFIYDYTLLTLSLNGVDHLNTSTSLNINDSSGNSLISTRNDGSIYFGWYSGGSTGGTYGTYQSPTLRGIFLQGGLGTGTNSSNYANTFVGIGAGNGFFLQTITNRQSFNIAFGGNALQSLTTGSGNVTIGYNAGGNITTSGYNTIIGHNTGLNINGGFNIVIGASNAYTSINTSTNNIIIGTSINQMPLTSYNFIIGTNKDYSNITSGMGNILIMPVSGSSQTQYDVSGSIGLNGIPKGGGQFVVGDIITGSIINSFYLGGVDTNSIGNLQPGYLITSLGLNGTSSSNVINTAYLRIASPSGTGNGNSGNLYLSVALPNSSGLTTLTTIATTSGSYYTFTSHGLITGNIIQLSGTIPAGLSAATNYWVCGATANTFQISSTFGGLPLTLGTHSSCGIVVSYPNNKNIIYNNNITILGSNGYVGVNTSSPGALLAIGASTVNVASLNIIHGVNPITPNSGDIWNNNTDLRISTLNLSLDTVGSGFKIKEGPNAKMGVGTLLGGTVTILNINITPNSRIFLSDIGGGTNVGALYVSSISVGTQFIVKSTNSSDTSSFNWIIFEPS